MKKLFSLFLAVLTASILLSCNKDLDFSKLQGSWVVISGTATTTSDGETFEEPLEVEYPADMFHFGPGNKGWLYNEEIWGLQEFIFSRSGKKLTIKPDYSKSKYDNSISDKPVQTHAKAKMEFTIEMINAQNMILSGYTVEDIPDNMTWHITFELEKDNSISTVKQWEEEML